MRDAVFPLSTGARADNSRVSRSGPPASNVAGMPADLTSGPEAPPADELAAAEATLRVLQQVVHGVATDDLARPTPCREFDVAALTDHLLNSITSIGSVAGAELPQRDRADSVERQLIAAARPVLKILPMEKRPFVPRISSVKNKRQEVCHAN